nr:glycolate oxidase subunit GlcF [Rubrobacter taiwanensis]
MAERPDGSPDRAGYAQENEAGRVDTPAQEEAAAHAVGAKRPEDIGHKVVPASRVAEKAAVEAGKRRAGKQVFPAFDDHNPPEQELIDDCVHCGFCLPTCPTYVLFGEEMDSPRGRIYLMEQGRQGEPLSDSMVRHFDLCLGCMACVTACPSGVQYDKLIESTRQQVERRYERSPEDRWFREMIFALFPYPERLRVATAPLKLYQRFNIGEVLRKSGALNLLPRRLRAMEALMPELPDGGEEVPGFTPARGQIRRRVGVLTGCVQRVFFPHVNAATVRVLAADGCEVLAPEQGCCGALSMHAGREEEARRFARRTIDAFEAAGVENVVVNAAGCGSTMKEYGYLLRDDPEYAERAKEFSARVRDASEFLNELGPAAERHPLPVVAAYHDACHLAHAQGIRRQPREELRRIPGLKIREIREAEICCGSAGIYNMVEPAAAEELGRRKAEHVLETGAQMLVTANPGCLLQIRASLQRMGEKMPMAHPMQVLDASIRGEPVTALLG